jgi:hypothetical protein
MLAPCVRFWQPGCDFGTLFVVWTIIRVIWTLMRVIFTRYVFSLSLSALSTKRSIEKDIIFIKSKIPHQHHKLTLGVCRKCRNVENNALVWMMTKNLNDSRIQDGGEMVWLNQNLKSIFSNFLILFIVLSGQQIMPHLSLLSRFV